MSLLENISAHNGNFMIRLKRNQFEIRIVIDFKMVRLGSKILEN